MVKNIKIGSNPHSVVDPLYRGISSVQVVNDDGLAINGLPEGHDLRFVYIDKAVEGDVFYVAHSPSNSKKDLSLAIGQMCDLRNVNVDSAGSGKTQSTVLVVKYNSDDGYSGKILLRKGDANPTDTFASHTRTLDVLLHFGDLWKPRK